jgi:hypothetical protein
MYLTDVKTLSTSNRAVRNPLYMISSNTFLPNAVRSLRSVAVAENWLSFVEGPILVVAIDPTLMLSRLRALG